MLALDKWPVLTRQERFLGEEVRQTSQQDTARREVNLFVRRPRHFLLGNLFLDEEISSTFKQLKTSSVGHCKDQESTEDTPAVTAQKSWNWNYIMHWSKHL